MICKYLSAEVKVLKYLHEPHNQTSYGLLHKIAYIAGPDQPAFKNRIYCFYLSCRQTSTCSSSVLSFVSSCSQSTRYLLTPLPLPGEDKALRLTNSKVIWILIWLVASVFVNSINISTRYPLTQSHLPGEEIYKEITIYYL